MLVKEAKALAKVLLMSPAAKIRQDEVARPNGEVMP